MKRADDVSALAWLWLVAGLALVVAPHLLRLPAWLGLICVGAIGWRLMSDLKGWRLPGKLLRFVFTAGAIAAIVLHYGTLLGRDPGVALLAIMLCLKLMEMRSLRDAMVVVLLAYFLLATGFLFSQSVFTGLYLFGVVVVLTAGLVVLHHPGADAAHTRQYFIRAGELLIQAIPMMVLLFILFPRISGTLWGLPTDARSARTGLSGEMSIGDVGRLADSSEVAFRVEFESEPPPASVMYWRGPVLWHTDGRRWGQLTREEAMTAMDSPARYEPLGESVSYTVTLEPHGNRWLLALDLPADVPEKAIVTPDFQLLSIPKVDQLRRYSVRSHTHYRTEAPSPVLRKAALALPSGLPRTRALAQYWREQSTSDAELVATALGYFKEQPFRYTREPPPLGSEPLEQFLFETRQGFCEHYAAAFVVLMRAAGLPARVVTGYQGGELNPLGRYVLVRQSDAHAWAEVFVEGRGWIRVDPTAVIPPSRIEAPRDLGRFQGIERRQSAGDTVSWLVRAWGAAAQGWDAINYGWNLWVLGYSRDQQQELLRRLGIERFGWKGMIAALFVGLAVVGIAVAIYLARRVRRHSDPVALLYQHFCDRLARRGMQRRKDEGALDFARRIGTKWPELTEQAQRIATLYQGLRYGSGEDVGALKQAIREFRR